MGPGLSVAIGAALSKKLNEDNNTVFALIGDGELQEGQNWEAIMFASGKKVDNLIATIDLNGKQIDGKTDDVMPMGNIAIKFKAFGWEVIELNEGNDLKAVIKTLQLAKSKTGNGRPIVIIMQTEMGNGVDYMMHTHAWHGKAPNDKLLAKALDQNPETLGDY